MGMTRGFFYAGAERVLVSLWNVNDRVTVELMRRFYRGMLEEGLSPAAALRAAQDGIRRQERWRAPYYWAGFTLQGEWRGDARPTATITRTRRASPGPWSRSSGKARDRRSPAAGVRPPGSVVVPFPPDATSMWIVGSGAADSSTVTALASGSGEACGAIVRLLLSMVLSPFDVVEISTNLIDLAVAGVGLVAAASASSRSKRRPSVARR